MHAGLRRLVDTHDDLQHLLAVCPGRDESDSELRGAGRDPPLLLNSTRIQSFR